jgi:hypothetical protein
MPALQQGYAAGVCAGAAAVEFRLYPGLDHLSLVARDSPFSSDLVAWARDRLAGIAVPPLACPERP